MMKITEHENALRVAIEQLSLATADVESDNELGSDDEDVDATADDFGFVLGYGDEVVPMPAKAEVPTGDAKEAALIEKSREYLYRALAVTTHHSLKVLSDAVWIPELGMARFKVLHGNVSANMGRYYNGVGYLLPEEVLLLADLGNLILWFQGYPLSLQEVYDFALEHIDAGDYLTYAHLRRLGYVVTRFDLGFHGFPEAAGQVLDRVHGPLKARKDETSLKDLSLAIAGHCQVMKEDFAEKLKDLQPHIQSRLKPLPSKSRHESRNDSRIQPRYTIYRPQSKFNRKYPPRPLCHLQIQHFTDPPPMYLDDLLHVERLDTSSDNQVIPTYLAIQDHGCLSFYRLVEPTF